MDLKKIFLAGLFSAVTLFGATFNIDKSHSSVAFKVKHMMISNVKGSFDDFKGSFELDANNNLSSLYGEVKVASINTSNAKRDSHLQADDMFDAAKYPNITFKLTKFEDDKAYGEFTMKGVTKTIALDYEQGGVIDNPRGGKIAGFSLSGKIKRSEFGLTWNKMLEAGGVAVSDDVKLEIEIEGKSK